MQAERKLVAMNPKLHRVAHRSKLNKSHLHAGDNTHIQKVLPEGTLTANSTNNAGLSNRQVT